MAGEREGVVVERVRRRRVGMAETSLGENTMPPDSLEPQGEPLLHLAERQDVVIWPLEPLAGRKERASTGSTE